MPEAILRKYGWVLAMLPALAGMVLIFLATPNGVGLSPDSVSYIRGARALLQDSSLAGLPTHWPPLYPMLLALFSLPGGDTLLAARLICVLACGVNLFLFCRLLRIGGWHPFVAAVFGVLLACDADFFYLHLLGLSEAVFLIPLLAGLCLLLSDDDGERPLYTAGAGLAFGLAALTRYIGVAFVAILCCILLWRALRTYDATARRRHIAWAVGACLAATLPMCCWVLTRNDVSHGSIKSFVYHPITAQKWDECLRTISLWFGIWPLLALLVLALAALLFWRWKSLPGQARQLLIYATLLAAAYLAFLWVSLSFFDAYVPLDKRILLPFKVLLLLAIAVALSAIPAKVRLVPIALYVGLVITTNYPFFLTQLQDSSRQGLLFAQVSLRDMPVLRYMREHKVVVDASNSPELTLLYLGRDIPMLPSTFDPTTNLPYPSFPQEMNRLAHPGSQVALFTGLMWRQYLPGAEQLVQAGFTDVVYAQPDGIILRHP